WSSPGGPADAAPADPFGAGRESVEQLNIEAENPGLVRVSLHMPLIRHFPDGRGPSPSMGSDTALATSQARGFCRRDARPRGPGRLRAASGLTTAPEDARRAQLDPRRPSVPPF